MNDNILFHPLKIGSLTIKNRFVMPAMESGTTKEHRFTEQSKSYFLARAKGGFGLIITDYTAVDPLGIGVPDEPGLWDDCFIEDLKELTDLIHNHSDANIFTQLHHSGMMCVEKTTGVPPKGPSAIAAPNYKERVTALSSEEIYTLIEEYGDAALRAKKAGFDGVEVHAAHGYQIAQFLSKFSNKRTDEFGGSYQNRFRFAEYIIKNIRQKCGDDFPMLFRISCEEFLESGNTIEDAVIYCQMAEAAGVHAIHASTGTGIGGNVVTPHYFRPGFNTKNAAQIKKAVSIPVIAVGRINDPALALSVVKNGLADMVTLGRQSICDPDFPRKLQEGRENEIFHCTGCMQRCYYTPGCEAGDTGVSCMLNPFSGKESRWQITPAKQPKRIAVIGAGPGGLEAAWVLAARGHHVTVYEKGSVAGGNFCLAAVPPGKQDLAYAIYTYTELCKKYGVTVHYDSEITSENLSDIDADVLVLATGAKPLTPGIPGLQEYASATADAILSGQTILSDENVLILGGGLVGCETAEFLHLYHNSVTIVDMAPALAKECVKRSRTVLLQNLARHKTVSYLDTKISSITADGMIGEQNGKEITLSGYTKIVLALGYRSYNPLAETAENYFSEVYTIGDAKKARDAKLAIYEGAKLGLSI